MPGMGDSYLDNLLNSIEESESRQNEDMSSLEALGQLLSDSEDINESESGSRAVDEGDSVNLNGNIVEDIDANIGEGTDDSVPDYKEPDLSESDMERFNSMQLDSILDDINADSITMAELFGESQDSAYEDDAASTDTSGADTAEAVTSDLERNEEVTEIVDNDMDILAAAALLGNNVSSTPSVDTSNIPDTPQAEVMADGTNQPDVKEQGTEDVSSHAATRGSEDTTTGSEDTTDGDEALKKSKRSKKNKKEKKQTGGFKALVKSIFFETEEGTQETKNAKKIGKKAAKEAKVQAKKDEEAFTKSTVINDDGREVADENQRLLKEMYGDNKEEVAETKTGFIGKLKYGLAQFMKKNEQEDKAEQEAEDKEYEERKKLKAEKKEADKVKKEEAKAKKEEKKKAKADKPKKEKKVKPAPRPEDILKIKPKSMFLFVLFTVGAIILIVMLSTQTGYSLSVSKAKAGIERGDYSEAYSALSGLDLNDNDKALYEQVSVIMYVERHYEAFENYTLMGRHTDALDSLITGLVRYDAFKSKAEELGVIKQLTESKDKIRNEIKESYKISDGEIDRLVRMSNENPAQYYKIIEAYGSIR